MPHTRIIGIHSGTLPGPLVIVVGALHGNEPAGIIALEKTMRLLKSLPKETPFKGRLVGLIGHQSAYQQQIRFFQEDLNRLWIPSRLEDVKKKSATARTPDECELADLYRCIQDQVDAYEPETLVVLDLHTTSAADGLFSIPTDEAKSLRLAKALHAPVVLNLFEKVEGTLLRFSVEGGFRNKKGLPLHTMGVAFEAGQHSDPQAADRSAAAIFNCLISMGCLSPDAPDAGYDIKLRAASASLPKVVRLHSVHHIGPHDDFKMRPGYRNFQPVIHGEHLADDIHGPVRAQTDGHILMPLYQALGTEGFFMVSRDVSKHHRH